MNKLTKLHLIIPALFLLPMSAMATGYYTTTDGKDHMLDAEKMKQDIKNNKDGLAKAAKGLKAKGAKGEKGMRGYTGAMGSTGAKGDKGMKGDTGARGLAGDSFYAGNYGDLDLLSVMAIGDAIANMPAPTSNGFFVSAGFSDLGGENANAVGIYYVDDVLSYKVTYGHSGHERSIGLGIGVRL